MRPGDPAVLQVTRDGAVVLVSGLRAEGTSEMALSKRRGLGPEGATRLAETMREAPPMMLAKLDIRQYRSAPNPLTSLIIYLLSISLPLSL